MITNSTYNLLRAKHERTKLILMLLLFFVLSTIVLDFYYAKLNGGSFYISESILFSSFWLLFFPLLHYQYKLIKKGEKILFSFSVSILIIFLHTFSYPALVWLLSKLFYYHTYSYWQTLTYELTEYSLIILLIYGFSLAIFQWMQREFNVRPASIENQNTNKEPLNSLIVTEANNKKTVIKIEDILYFSANTPYINIHHRAKKYLYNQTLKSLASNLNSNQFVRIHKSYIVNVNMVSSFKSRLNGDYDLTLNDNTVLRISRNYASNFKRLFEAAHHHSLK